MATGDKRQKAVKARLERYASGKTRARNVARGAKSSLRSKLTSRGQTTVPSGVRKALGLRAGEQIRYEIQGDRVIMWRVVDEADPAVVAFLDFLEKDMVENPSAMQPVTESFATRLRELTSGVAVDDDERIEGSVAL